MGKIVVVVAQLDIEPGPQPRSYSFEEVVAMMISHASMQGESVHFNMGNMSDNEADLVGQLRAERKWDLVVREIKRRLQAAG